MSEDNKDPNMGVFDTHKFLFTLNHEHGVVGHSVEFVGRDSEIKRIELSKIEIGTSPVSCKLFDLDGNRFLVPFIRVQKIYKQGELVWDNTDADISDAKVIKGFD